MLITRGNTESDPGPAPLDDAVGASKSPEVESHGPETANRKALGSLGTGRLEDWKTGEMWIFLNGLYRYQKGCY